MSNMPGNRSSDDDDNTLECHTLLFTRGVLGIYILIIIMLLMLMLCIVIYIYIFILSCFILLIMHPFLIIKIERKKGNRFLLS